MRCRCVSAACDILGALGTRPRVRLDVVNALASNPSCQQGRGNFLASPSRAAVYGAPVIALVGYTNAGKSTLFNALVKARAYAADQLFATLDTTTRQLYLGHADGSGRSVSLSDTVGFIRDLPHSLIDAFQATLQEAADATLLMHVVDASNPDFPEQMAEVQKVLDACFASDAAHAPVKV